MSHFACGLILGFYWFIFAQQNNETHSRCRKTDIRDNSKPIMDTKKQLDITLPILIAAVFTGAFLLAFPEVLLNPTESKAAGLAIITLGLFATARIPEYLTALLFFLLAILFSVAPARIVFSGFQSTALWLVFGGLVIGVAITATGLGKRMAGKLAGHLEGSYTKLIGGMTIVGIAFAFIMPSAMGRIILLTPIAIALADHFGFQKGSNGRTGVVLATTLGSFIPAFSILPANVANMILAGMAESQFAISTLYGEYLLLHFPVLGLIKAILIVMVIIWLYPDNPVVTTDSEVNNAEPMSEQEKTLAIILTVLLILWLTDFIHHISPAWIALGGAIYLLLPRIGLLGNEHFNTKINYASMFFVAGVIGLGSMINHSGLGVFVGDYLVSVLPLSLEAPIVNYMSVSLASTLIGLLTTLQGVPAVMTPLSPEIAEVTGLSLKSILMIQVLGFSTILLPYQAPPLVVAMQLSEQRLRSIVKPLLIIALVTYAIIFPVNYLWWRFITWI